ncbi:hypothetical protein Tco_0504642 [Tanacetum coccineum]
MSTSKTYQQSLADAGSENRPPMLERASYIPWASRFRRYLNRKRDNRKWLLKALDEGPYEFKEFVPKGSTIPRLQTVKDLKGDDLLFHDAEMEVMNMILLSIPNEIYNYVDACTSTKDMWKRVEPHTGSSSRNTSSYYVTHSTSVVDYEDEYQLDDVHTNYEDPLTSAMLVNIQSRNSSNARRNNRRAYVQEEIVEGSNASNETKNVQRTLRTSVQPADNTSDAGPSYDSAFINDQIDRDIIFDSSNGNVNSGSIEKDTHVPDLYIIQDLEKQRDKLDLDVKDYKRQNEELQKTHSILKRQMSENEDRCHDTVLDLEAKLKKNVDLILKLGNSLQGMLMLRPKPLSV